MGSRMKKKQKKKQFIESQKHELTQLYESNPMDFFFFFERCGFEVKFDFCRPIRVSELIRLRT